MIDNKLPSVLQHRRGSISMERALKQIKDLLYNIDTSDNESLYDKVQASIDDVETMLDNIV